MTKEELDKITQMPNVAIIAPAGHGKTEMIVDIVKHSTGKKLLLTHTNAGVNAIDKRLQNRSIPKEKYTVTTIAAFCIKWCVSYNNTGCFDKVLSPLNGKEESTAYYSQLYRGAKKIFQNDWAGSVLKATYTGIVVDEYQDCIQPQHEIMLAMNKYLPIVVLGDPMQGIFSFDGELVDWNHLEFPIVKVSTQPWRWENSNPELGQYLISVREQLLPTLSKHCCTIQIVPGNKSVEIISPIIFTGYSHLRALSQFSSVVYITQWPKQQLDFCVRMSGIFQYDEKQDCSELFYYSKLFDTKSGSELALMIIEFASKCSTGVKKELKSYITKLSANSFDFSRIKKYPDFRDILVKEAPDITQEAILKMLMWFFANPVFKRYRSELFSEMIRSVKYSIAHQTSIFNAANHIRKDLRLQKNYTGFKFLSSRTLLSKGLEFDCAIIDMSTPLSARDFYVAMTRAKKKIYIISNTNTFTFES